MTPEERDIRLTAYALEDPGLSPEERKDIEASLKLDPAARKAFLETREVARILAAGLAAEQAAAPAGPPVVTIPSEAAARPKPHRWFHYSAVAALLALFGGTFLGWTLNETIRGTTARHAARPVGTPEVAALNSSVAADPATSPKATPSPLDPRGQTAHSLKQGETGAGGLSGHVPGRPGGGIQGGFGGGGLGGFGGYPHSGAGVPGASGFGGIGGFGGVPGAGMPGGPGLGGGGIGGGGIGGGIPGGPGGAPAPRLATPTTPPPPPPAPGSSHNTTFERLPPDSRPAAAPKDTFDRSIATTGKTREHRYEMQDNGEWKLKGEVLDDGSVVPIQGNTPPSPNDRYPALIENRFIAVEGLAALSTFGVDVDTASYSIARKYLSMGQLPPANAVRLEELVNYFPYADKAPDGDDPFAVTVELAECPWQPKHRLARIGLKAKPIATDKRPPSNLVFLIDVSGSMNEPNKLPLVKASLKLLVEQLGENDRVAMVVYAGTTGLVLDSTSAMHKDRILAALDRLEAGGSTYGSGGLQQAYSVAAANFIKGGTNRVILCTDGDWNVGTTSTEALVNMIEEKRQTGVFLSVFGFGMGNLRDEMMVKLAGKGNGNYGYIDTLREAHKSLVEQLGGTLVTVAKDVKIQVEFNPATVRAYRLLGYEKRALAAKDFADDKKDAGEMGAGHVVTALYELVPAGGAAPTNPEDNLRYQQNPEPKVAAKDSKASESFVVKMRHKKPDGDTSTLRELPVTDPGKGYADASEDFRFAAAVASFAMLLRDSPFKGNATFGAVQELAAAAAKTDPGGYRAEFLELVRRAKAISGKP